MLNSSIPGMPTSIHTNDVIDQWILRDSLKIVSVHFNMPTNQMIIDLNTQAKLEFLISDFPILNGASKADLELFTLIGDGIGIHWPKLDEDLSLKGFLLADLKKRVG